MTIKKAKENISKIKWYYQGGAVKPLYISYPWYTCSLMKIFGKKIPVKYELMIYVKNDFMDDYISFRSLEKVGKYYYEKQKRDDKFIYKLIKNWRSQFVCPFLKINKEILRGKLSQLGNKRLLEIFQDFSSVYLALWHEAIFLDAFDYCSDIILKKIIKEEGVEIKPKDLEILLAPFFPSFLQRERMEILALAEKILKKGSKKEVLTSLINKNISDGLEKISVKYYWLYNDYAQIHYLDKKYFLSRVSRLLKNKNELKKEKETRLELNNIRRKKVAVIKEYCFSKKFINPIDFLATLGNFRDERKSYNQMAGNTIKKLVKEISKRANLPLAAVENMCHWEIKNIFSLSDKQLRDINSRSRGWFYYITAPDKFLSFKARAGRELNDFLKNIIHNNSSSKGRVAFTGIVKSIVKIIRDKNDFSKMKKGDILVAPNTRPEYVSIMKIAGAIITDEGGLTCHAAIISRELKIPCIVGMQGATSILKDGDLVEVDANEGIVRTIK